MTNEEKIKRETTEALAGRLAALTFHIEGDYPCYHYPYANELSCYERSDYDKAVDQWVKWLKEEAK